MAAGDGIREAPSRPGGHRQGAREASAARLKPLQDAARAEWLKLYALLGEDQVAIVKGFLEERLGHLEALQKFVISLMLGKVATP